MSILDRVRILAQRLSSPDSSDDEIFRAIMSDFELVTSAGEFARKYGMSRSTISRWRSGHSVPHPALRPRIYQWLRKLANAKVVELTTEHEYAKAGATKDEEKTHIRATG
jgi:transcriptional regulator with XRE-family HTH domain